VGDDPDLILVATGSEVSVAVAAADILAAGGLFARVVSLPSWDLFQAQGPEYHEQILPSSVPTLSIEAASSFGWDRWADEHVAIDRFGASAPGNEVLSRLGFTPENVAAQARALLDALQPDDD
jgi:transketolase